MVRVGAFVDDDGKETYQPHTIKLLVKSSNQSKQHFVITKTALNSKSVKIIVPAHMSCPSLDELMPWEARVGVGAFVGNDGGQTYYFLSIKLLVKCLRIKHT